MKSCAPVAKACCVWPCRLLCETAVIIDWFWAMLLQSPMAITLQWALGQRRGLKPCLPPRARNTSCSRAIKKESFAIACVSNEEQGEKPTHSCRWAWCSHIPQLSLWLFTGLYSRPLNPVRAVAWSCKVLSSPLEARRVPSSGYDVGLPSSSSVSSVESVPVGKSLPPL